MPTDYLLSIDLGVKNFAYCVIDIINERIFKWDCVDIGDVKDPHEKICTNLAKKLDELKLTQVPNKYTEKKNMIVVVELQPKSNIRTLVLSGQVQMYFVLEKLSSEGLDSSFCNIEKIVGYHARNKLRYYEPQPGDEPLGPALDHVKKGYYKNKKTAKEHCKRVLLQKNEDPKWMEFYARKEKQDDKADCYLQGLAYKKFVMSRGDNPEGSNRPKKDKKTCKGLTKKKEPCNSAVTKKNSYCKKHTKQKLKVKKPKPKKEVVKKIVEKVLCKGSTKKGEPCKYKASIGSFCKTHSS
jgi:hypothetical protein